MKGTQLTNPLGAFVTTTTFVSGVDSEGGDHEYGALVIEVRANAACVRGAGMSWVNPTATVPVSVTPMAAATTDLDWAGVSLHAAAAGSLVKIAVEGFCLVNMAAQTAAAGEMLVNPTTTAGELIRIAAPVLDATSVMGTILGRVFGIKNATTNLALCFLRQY